MKKAIASGKIAPPVGPFSAAIAVNDWLFLSGQVGQDPNTRRLIDGGVTEQVEQAFTNIAAVLEAANRGFADVVRVGVYLTDMSDFAAMNAVYAKHFSEPYPARTTVCVKALPLGAAVEIDVVARK